MLAFLGAIFFDDLNLWLPKPPFPPLRNIFSVVSSEISNNFTE